MAVSTISGAATTASPVANELRVDMRSAIAMLDPQTTQFTTMLMQLPVERANSFKVEWLEDQLFPRLTSLAATAASADTTLTLTTNTGNYFRAGDVIRVVSTGEACLVTSASASSVAVTRALGSVAAASAASGVNVVIVANSNAQGALLPTILMTARVAQYNYTNIARHSYGFTRTANATQWYGGPLLDKERQKKAIEHKWSIERSLFYGPRYYTATGPQHTSGGLIEYISTNINSAGGTFTKANLQTFLRAGMQHGSQNKVLFASPLVAAVMAQYLQDNWVRAGTDETVWGVKIDAVIASAYGSEVPVIVKRDWNDYSTGTANDYGSRAFLVDMSNVQFAPLQDTVQLRNRQAPDYDGVKEEYLTEFSLKLEQEPTHAAWTNITG